MTPSFPTQRSSDLAAEMLVLEKSLVGFRSQPELAILLDERLDTRVMPEPLPGLRGIRRQAVLVGPSLEKAVGAAPLAVRRLAHELKDRKSTRLNSSH